MPTEVALFWLLVAGFLFADNLVLVPGGGDYLKFGRRGRLVYLPGQRLQARGRDLVLLNPLNPFDRIALTRDIAGPSGAGPWRSARRQVRASLPGANAMSWLGVIYLLVLLALLLLSFHWHFGVVLAALAAWHLLAWGCGLTLLLRHRTALRLSGGQVAALAAEALFVPAYTLNLGKRVWYRHTLELPALTLGLWRLKHQPSAGRDLYAHQLAERLDDWALDLGPGGSTPQHTWLKEARACLTASTPPVGS